MLLMLNAKIYDAISVGNAVANAKNIGRIYPNCDVEDIGINIPK